MGSDSLEWRSSTRKDLRKIPPHEIARILTHVESLAGETFPHGSEKLAGSEHTDRIRIGD